MALPTCDFRWLTQEEIDDLIIEDADLDGEYGYLLEVDLIYPEEIHDKTRDFPFAPEKCKISQENFTPFQMNQYQTAYGKQKYPGYSKLLLTQWNKERYTVHGKLLKFYLNNGMDYSKVHRVLKFKQTYIFRDYIAFNSKKRQEATNSFEKDYYKLKNNSLYGKLQISFNLIIYKIIKSTALIFQVKWLRM